MKTTKTITRPVPVPATSDTAAADIIMTRVLLLHGQAAHLWVELEQNDEQPDELRLTIEGTCFNGSAKLGGDREGWCCELDNAEAIRTLGETLINLANRAESRGMLDALRVHTAARS